MMSPTERLLAALEKHGGQPKQNGQGWSAHCPAHDDQRPSLTVSEGDDLHLDASGGFAGTGAARQGFLHLSPLIVMARKPDKSPAQPVTRYEYGDVSAAVFREERETKGGKTFISYNVSLRRSYRKDDGFAHTHTLRQSDLVNAIDALMDCKKYIFESRETAQSDKTQSAA